VLSSPLAVDGRPAGALNLYSRTAHAFAPIHEEFASVVAEQTAMLLAEPGSTTAIGFDDRIRDALASRDGIAQAQGILMERLGVDARTAYATMRRDAARTSTRLGTRAREIIAEAEGRSDRRR